MLKNAHLLAKIDADTAENEQHCAENLPKIGARAAPRRAGRPSARWALRWLPTSLRMLWRAPSSPQRCTASCTAGTRYNCSYF